MFEARIAAVREDRVRPPEDLRPSRRRPRPPPRPSGRRRRGRRRPSTRPSTSSGSAPALLGQPGQAPPHRREAAVGRPGRAVVQRHPPPGGRDHLRDPARPSGPRRRRARARSPRAATYRRSQGAPPSVSAALPSRPMKTAPRRRRGPVPAGGDPPRARARPPGRRRRPQPRRARAARGERSAGWSTSPTRRPCSRTPSDLQIDGVLTVQAERAVPMVAAIAEALGLPGIGAETAHLMTNKPAMRRGLDEAGVPQPRFDDGLDGGRGAGGRRRRSAFPPCSSPRTRAARSRVFRLRSLDELEAQAEEALDGLAGRGRDPRGVRRGDGAERHRRRAGRRGALGDPLRPAAPGRPELRRQLDPPLPAALDDGPARARRRGSPPTRALALGLRTGIAFPQLIAAPDGRVSVVECAARIGGMMAELTRARARHRPARDRDPPRARRAR